jgi:hypothetical protein
MSTNYFQDACATYKYLRNRGYPEKASLKLVADRHRLSRLERNCLFRGIVVDDTASFRRKKVLVTVAGRPLAIDWYNVLITVESYLRGQQLFLADDGVVRDASATHGSYRTSDLTSRAMQGIVEVLHRLQPARVDVWLDEPIAFSGRMAEELRGRMASLLCPALVELAPSADYPLKRYPGVIATSDSVLLDNASAVFDLARGALQEAFGFTPLPVLNLFPQDAEEPRQ